MMSIHRFRYMMHIPFLCVTWGGREGGRQQKKYQPIDSSGRVVALEIFLGRFHICCLRVRSLDFGLDVCFPTSWFPVNTLLLNWFCDLTGRSRADSDSIEFAVGAEHKTIYNYIIPPGRRHKSLSLFQTRSGKVGKLLRNVF